MNVTSVENCGKISIPYLNEMFLPQSHVLIAKRKIVFVSLGQIVLLVWEQTGP